MVTHRDREALDIVGREVLIDAERLRLRQLEVSCEGLEADAKLTPRAPQPRGEEFAWEGQRNVFDLAYDPLSTPLQNSAFVLE
jgi:hypothetical protein